MAPRAKPCMFECGREYVVSRTDLVIHSAGRFVNTHTMGRTMDQD